MEHLLEPIKNPTIADAKKTPGAFLKQIMGKPVEVKLRDGTLFKGTLVWLDGCLNVCLEKWCQIDPSKLNNNFIISIQ